MRRRKVWVHIQRLRELLYYLIKPSGKVERPPHKCIIGSYVPAPLSFLKMGRQSEPSRGSMIRTIP
jgi:hypothetical protein